MVTYSKVVIIYNPHSTGPGQRMAEEFAESIRTVLPEVDIAVVPTQYAGHAEELAYDIAKSTEQPLIISASGDGGYNEVVNGAMRAQQEGSQPILGLLPAGNANDHHHSLHDTDLPEAIAAATYREVDVLRMDIEKDSGPWTRYGHSYIGFGLSPRVGKRLTQAKLNLYNEAWLTLRTLLQGPRCTIELDGVRQRYDNFVVSNIPRMAKFMTLAPNAKVDDGYFEVTKHQYEGRIRMFQHLLNASSVGLTNPEVRANLVMQFPRRTSVQVDGEVFGVPENSTVRIMSVHRALRCFI